MRYVDLMYYAGTELKYGSVAIDELCTVQIYVHS